MRSLVKSSIACSVLGITLAVIVPITGAKAAKPDYLLEKFQRGNAIVETSGIRCLLLSIYFADDPEQRAQGLMFIRELGAREGMLFRYGGSARLTMWMKNTYVGLDMLFIRSDGTIAQIASNTIPESTARISSSEPVMAVLEVNAGFAERWMIEPGNRLLAVSEFRG